MNETLQVVVKEPVPLSEGTRLGQHAENLLGTDCSVGGLDKHAFVRSFIHSSFCKQSLEPTVFETHCVHRGNKHFQSAIPWDRQLQQTQLL